MDFCVMLISSRESLILCIRDGSNQSSNENTDTDEWRVQCEHAHKQTHIYAHQPVFSSRLHSLNREVVKLTVQLQLCYIDTPPTPVMYYKVVQLF